MSLADHSIPCPLSQAARDHGSSSAIIWGARRITFQQLNQYVNSTVKSFKERNIKAGSRVAIVSDNSAESIIILLSLWRLGAVACPINPRFPDAKIRALLQQAGALAVIVGRSDILSAKLFMPRINITDLIVFDVKDSFYKNESTLSLTVDGKQEAVVIFTSGSSAAPKAAVLTYGNLYFNALGSNTVISLTKDDRWLLALPLFHVAGLGILFRCLLAGAAVVIAPQEDLNDLMVKGKVTHVSMVPTQLRRYIDTHVGPRHAVAVRRVHTVAVRAILLGGSAIPASLLQEALRLNLPIYVSYGLTEMASQVATGRATVDAKSCAQVLPHRELKIAPDGEIGVRGQTLFKGYLEQGVIRLPVDTDGWFLTGDLGALDDQGCLTVKGRKDNMFISGGENIHPEEIEAEILKMPGVDQVVVVPKEDQEFGQRPVAFVLLAEGSSLSYDEIGQQLLKTLPKFKIPIAFYPWAEDAGELKASRKECSDRINKRTSDA